MEEVSLPPSEATARSERQRKRAAARSALDTVIADAHATVVKVKREKEELADDLEEGHDLTSAVTVHSDWLMAHIDALKQHIVALGAKPVDAPPLPSLQS